MIDTVGIERVIVRGSNVRCARVMNKLPIEGLFVFVTDKTDDNIETLK